MLSAEEYLAAFEASPDGILIVAEDGSIRDANPAAETLFGYGRDELVGQPVEVLVPDAARARHERHRARYRAAPHARPMGIDLMLRGRRRDGSEVPVEISLSPLAGGKTGDVICSVRDVSERIRLRDFSRATTRSAEEERQRIARELHDDTAQRLATLLVRVRLLGYVTDEEERHHELVALREQLREVAEGVRRIARGLRPPALDEVGLTSALEAHLRDLREGANFDVRADMGSVDHLLDEDRRLTVYRIVQESLSNARRHSGVDHAYLKLYADEGRVVAEVEDHGRGFEAEQAHSLGGGLGLVGMHERAVLFGGRVTVRSGPGEGTRIRVELPGAVKEPAHG